MSSPPAAASAPAASAAPPSAIGRAIAFTLKSRFARSSSMVSPWSGAKS